MSAATEKTWAGVWREYVWGDGYRHGWATRIARKHGVPVRALRARVRAENWDLKRRRERAQAHARQVESWVEKARRRSLAAIERVVPLLRAGGITADPRTLREVARVAWEAGHHLQSVYSVGSWLARDHDELARVAAGKDRRGPGSPWGGFPDLPPMPWDPLKRRAAPRPTA